MKTPEMTTGTVEMVSVEWIMKNTTHSVDGYDGTDWGNNPTDGRGVDYARMVRSKGRDTQMADVIYTIQEMGFRVPIVLDLAYSGDGSITHGNGHHRMVAAILLCLDEIPVYWSDGDYMASYTSDTEPLQTGLWPDLRDMLDEELIDVR